MPSPGSYIHGILQAKVLEWVDFPSPGDLPNPGSNLGLLHCRWILSNTTAAVAKSLQSCPTLCDPIDSSPPGSPIPGILQTLTPFNSMMAERDEEVAKEKS